MYPPAARTRQRELVVPLVVLGVGACLAVVLVAVIGLTGGLAEAGEEDEVPQAALEEKVETEAWDVTVIDAALFPPNALEPSTEPRDGYHWLVVLAEVEVTAPASHRVGQALEVTGIPGLAMSDLTDPPQPLPPELWRTRDGTAVVRLEPGLPERVLFLWQRSGEDTPQEVQVEVVDRVFRVSGISPYEHLYGKRSEWIYPIPDLPAARVTVPLKDRRDDPAFREEEE